MRFVLSVMSAKTRAMLVAIVLIAAAGSYFVSQWPVVLAEVYDGLSTGAIASFAQAAPLVAWFAACLVLAELLSILRRVATDVASADLEAQARTVGLSSALGLPVSRVGGALSAELAMQIDQGVRGCCDVFKLACNDLVPSVATVAFVAYQVVCGAPPVILACMLGYVLVSAGLSFFQIRSQNGIRDSINLKQSGLAGNVAQSLANHEGIRTMAAEGYEVERLSGAIKGIAQVEKYHHRVMGGFDSAKQSSKAFFFVAVLMLGVWLVSTGQMTGGAVVAATMLFNQLTVPLDAVYRLLDEFASSSVKIDRLADIAREAHEAVCAATPSDAAADSRAVEAACLASPVAMVEADGLDVVAPNGHTINGGLTFSIPAGTTFCLDGGNGCGKSSLMKTLLGYFPRKGGVSLLGRRLSDYAPRELADTVFYLPQVPFLFSGTIRDNIVYGLESVPSDDQLREALRLALVRPGEFGDDPLSYRLTENGGNLSGGQRQRIAAARLFLRLPAVLFADEATASIDVESAVRLMENVKAHMAKTGGNIVLITHQKEIKALCDGFLSLERGRLGLVSGREGAQAAVQAACAERQGERVPVAAVA